MMKIETVTKKKRIKFLLFIFVLVCVSLITIFLKPEILLSLSRLPENINCNLRGGVWQYQDPWLGYVYNGCVKKFVDGGKKCESGKECLSGVCYSMFETKQDQNGRYYGYCHKYLPIDSVLQYQPGCQEFIIDNGKIINKNECLN